MTGPQLARHVRAAVLALDPDAAEQRRMTALQDRAVALGASVDGMAWLSAYLPAPDAVMAFSVIDALAGTTRIDGDDRTVDQRRADAFTDVFTTILTNQATPDGTPLPRRHGQAVTIGVTVAASTLAGLDERPGPIWTRSGRSPPGWPASSPRTGPGGACSPTPPDKSSRSEPFNTGPVRT